MVAAFRTVDTRPSATSRTGRRLGISFPFSGFEIQQVVQLFLLRPQVGQGFRRRRRFAGTAGDDLDASAGEGPLPARIVRKQANAAEAELMQDGSRQAEGRRHCGLVAGSTEKATASV